MQNFRALGAPPPDPVPPVPPAAGVFAPRPPLASGGWGLCLRRLGALPPDPPNSPLIANFWLRACWSPSSLAPGGSATMLPSVTRLSWISLFNMEPKLRNFCAKKINLIHPS